MKTLNLLITISILFISTINAQNLNVGVDSTLFKKAVEYVNNSNIYTEKADFITAEKYLDSLYNFSKKHKLENFELISLIHKGTIYMNSGAYKKALEIYSTILKKCDKLPENINTQQVKIMAMQNMAGIYVEFESYEKSVAALEKALAIAEKINNNSEMVRGILSNLGSSYTILKQFDKSIKYQERVLKKAKIANDNFSIVHSLLGLSENYSEKGNFNTALSYAKKAHKHNEHIKTEKRKTDWVSLRTGLAFKGLQQLDSAKQYLLQARKFAITLKRQVVEIAAEENLAKVYEALGDFKNAQQSQKRFNTLNTQKLEEKREAEVTATKKEAEKELENVKEKNKTNTTYIVVFSLIAIALLGGFLIHKNRIKKKTEIENKQLQADFRWIEKQYVSLKESMLQLSKEREETKNGNKYKNSSLNKEDREKYMNKILEFMDTEKPYLNTELTQTEFAKKLEINSHHLSEVLALSFGQNFNNFINFYRVSKAQELLKSPKYVDYKIEAIGYEAGFNSKVSFNRVFKLITGNTPSQYRKIKA